MVEWRKESETAYESTTVTARSGSSQSVTIGGGNLSANTVYKVRVSAGSGTPVSYGAASEDATVRMPVVLTQKPTVTVTPGDKKLTVTWDAIQGADHYCIIWAQSDDTVYRGNESEGCPSGSPNVFSAADQRRYVIDKYNGRDLKNGTEYVVQVDARNRSTRTAWSDVEKATPMGAPEAPVISLTGGDTMITVAWIEDKNATDYEIQWRTAVQSFGAKGRRRNKSMQPAVVTLKSDPPSGIARRASCQ